ncbi:hypothetical protein HK405_006925 [Cladochytrium tenue]|nr:hypothetical protein HK405_006925 [Cladochytrium tenue]
MADAVEPPAGATGSQQQTTPRDTFADGCTVFERYYISKSLGEGTYGKVKLAVDLETGDKIALKVISKTAVKQKDHIKRIKREVRIMRLVNHPHIAKLYDVLETDREIVLCLQYVDGGELFDFIVAHPKLPEKTARKLFRQILSAIDYCHSSSIIHRDLKPENVLLDNKQQVKLIDFGFVNLYDPQDVLSTFCGSPYYASPEMISGVKYVGPEVDIWSLGVILFALLTGFLPFRDSVAAELCRKIVAAEFELPPFVSEDAADLIRSILKSDRFKRATMEQIRQHRWTMTGYDGPPDSYIPRRPRLTLPLEQSILESMRLYGFDPETVTDEIISPPPQAPLGFSHLTPAAAVYHLIREHEIASGTLGRTPTATRAISRVGSRSNSVHAGSLQVPSGLGHPKRRSVTQVRVSNASINDEYSSGGPQPTGASTSDIRPPNVANAIVPATASLSRPAKHAAVADPHSQPTPHLLVPPGAAAPPADSSCSPASTLSRKPGAAAAAASSSSHACLAPQSLERGRALRTTSVRAVRSPQTLSRSRTPSISPITATAPRPSEVGTFASHGSGSGGGASPKGPSLSTHSAPPIEALDAASLGVSPHGLEATPRAHTLTRDPTRVDRRPGSPKPTEERRRLSLAVVFDSAMRRVQSHRRSSSAYPQSPKSLSPSIDQLGTGTGELKSTDCPNSIHGIRTLRQFVSAECTTSLPPKAIAHELCRVLKSEFPTINWEGSVVECTSPKLRLSVEIYAIQDTTLHGLLWRRQKGPIWAYYTTTKSLMKKLNI